MGGQDSEEPIFIRKRGRFVYNPRNPVGRLLIVGGAVVVVGFMYHLFDDARWSEGEFRDAVREAAVRLEAEPQVLRGYLGYEERIEEAVKGTGQGPEHAVVRVEAVDEPDAAGAGDADVFEISTDDVGFPYCMRVSPPQPEPDALRLEKVRIAVEVAEGPC
ncbi:hypothetical protein QMZ92_11745 [Streptomyces sp. HNM0645]|uniref:hypothetical protein n=1 Tax=Streptomyces sp. HNM0645 TaxID=2782343 RepID=UPI0024B7CCE6|nr:hypothetical protein [Streptomyces sp. HNM0645]MDI9885048.1 hypothetical protein [Streptomyces sp. HNM0645]